MGRKQLLIVILIVLLLSIAKMAVRQHEYYLDLAAEDYYMRPGREPEGVWLPTTGTKRLNLTGKVQREDLRALFQGRLPDGTEFVQTARRGQRRPGHDLTFSVPKSLSVLWALSPPRERQAIQDCILHATGLVIQHIEQNVAVSRCGKAGHSLVPADIVVAAFQHATARAVGGGPPAPALHVHSLVINLALRHDGTTGALESSHFYHNKMISGALFRTHLAHLLQERLGLQTVRERDFFRIRGIPDKLVDSFTERRPVILSKLAEKGVYSPAAAEVATLETREQKKPTLSRSQLVDHWRNKAVSFGFTPADAVRLFHRVRPKNTIQNALRLADKAVETLVTRFTSFDKKQLVQEVLYAAVDSGVHPSKLFVAADQRLQSRTDILRTPDSPDHPRYTTTRAAALGKDLARAVARLQSARSRPPSVRNVEAAIERYSKPRSRFTDEIDHHFRQLGRAFHKAPTETINRSDVARRSQKTLLPHQPDTVRHLLSGPGRIKTLRTTPTPDRHVALDACRHGWEKAGRRVIGVSLSNAGATHLKAQTGIDSMTLKRLELRMRPTLAFQLRHHARQLWRASQHKKTYALERLRIDRGTVLVVDGAEQLSAKQLATLTQAVAKQGGQLVLVEASRRSGKKQAPTAFHDICKHLNHTQQDIDPDSSRRRQQQLAQLRETVHPLEPIGRSREHGHRDP